MRKNLLLLFAGLLLAAGYLNAQVLYSDDFESYTAGTGISAQEATWWNTWSGNPGAEDPLVSSAYAHDGVQSIQVAGTNDGVIEFADLTTGRYRIEFYIMVPAGTLGYYNIMQNFNPSGVGLIWGMQVFLQDGVMTIDGAGEAAATYNYTPGEWFKVQHFIDLDSDWVDMYINDVLIHAYQWSKGTFNDGSGVNKLDAFDFYAWDNDGAGTPEYYMDNFLIELVETPYPPTNFAYTLENLNDVVLTWEAPTEGTPESYSIARDGVVIGTTTELTLTDVGVYPNTYEYSLLAYYGTSSGYSAPQPLEVFIEGGNERNFVTFEMYTSVLCSYCPYVAQALEELSDEGLNDMAIMEFHGTGLGDDPFTTVATDYRSQYYLQWYDDNESGTLDYPTSVINGTYGIEGTAEDVAQMKELFQYQYDEYKSIPAVYTIETAVQQLTTEPFSFNLDITVEETFPFYTDETRLYIALTETDINYAWMGESQCLFVTRGFFPDETGLATDFSSVNPMTTSMTIPIDASYNVDNCEVIVFLQNITTGQVQQVAKEHLYSVSDVETDNTFNTVVFPNPANEILNIVADENINNIEVINMAGQVVYSENTAKENVQLNVANFSAGLYFVKVYTQDEVTIHKITVE